MRPRGYWFKLIDDTHILNRLKESTMTMISVIDVELNGRGAGLEPLSRHDDAAHPECFNMISTIMEYRARADYPSSVLLRLLVLHSAGPSWRRSPRPRRDVSRAGNYPIGL